MINFSVLVEGGFRPQKADASALGVLPTAGFRYCEPVRISSQFGWYVFLPFELSVIWESDNYYWSDDGFRNKYLIANAVQYPGFSERFDAAAPGTAKGFAPPFLSKTNDEDILQIWPGIFAQTEARVGLWTRGPANMGMTTSHYILEGVIETDWWFGPLFAMVKFIRGVPVVFKKERPFMQVMPFSMEFNEDFKKSNVDMSVGVESMTETDWQKYDETVVKRLKKGIKSGEYAVNSRKTK